MTQINKHIKSLKTSATLAINQKVKPMRNKGEIISHFGFGQSPFPIHDSIIKALKNNADNNNYLSSTGLEALKIEISKFLETFQGISVKSDYIFIGPGSKELLFHTLLILEGTFLIPKGSWVSYGPQINVKGGSWVVLETHFENNFKLNVETLKRYCKHNAEKQKILILNSPNNPTGAIYSSNELKEIAEVCKENDIVVLSDEIYSQINFNSNFSPSIHVFYPEKTIVFGGLSKVFSAGGYRLGFMALPINLEAFSNTFRSLFSETFSAVAAPIQYAAIQAYKMDKPLQNYIKTGTSILNHISAFIYSNLMKINLVCTQPQGAFYMMIGFNNFKIKINALGINTSEQLAIYLLENYKVALLPASDFYFNEEDLFLRLAFVDFDGLKAIKTYRKNYNTNDFFVKTYCPNIYKGVAQLKGFVINL